MDNFEAPTPRQVRTWEDAEHLARDWMRSFGFVDAKLTGGGADGGIDVYSRAALAQVKFQARQIGTPDLQRLFGARGASSEQRLLFFTGTSYSKQAVAYADATGIALFEYDPMGHIRAMNPAALTLMATNHELPPPRTVRELREQRGLEREARLARRIKPHPDTKFGKGAKQLLQRVHAEALDGAERVLAAFAVSPDRHGPGLLIVTTYRIIKTPVPKGIDTRTSVSADAIPLSELSSVSISSWVGRVVATYNDGDKQKLGWLAQAAGDTTVLTTVLRDLDVTVE